MGLWNYTAYNPLDVFEGVSLLTRGMFGTVIIVLLWLVVFYRQKEGAGSRDAIAVASFISAIAAILLSQLSLVNDYTLWATIIMSLGSLALLVTRPS